MKDRQTYKERHTDKERQTERETVVSIGRSQRTGLLEKSCFDEKRRIYFTSKQC